MDQATKKVNEGTRVILRKMASKKYIGKNQLPEVLCLRWIKNLSKIEHKEVLEDWKWCIRQELIKPTPTKSGIYVSLNPRKLDQVYALIGESY